MGLLVDGKWQDRWYDTEDGHFKREERTYRNWITKTGEPGPTGEGGFKAEKGRYHLFVSYACPWAHRTLIFRYLKSLEDYISVSIVNPHMGDHGWTFEADEGTIPDPILNAHYLHEIYTHVDPNFTGRVTVPVLYDKEKDTIVSNESSEIIRMFNSAFDELGAKPGDYYPEELREDIDRVNEFVYPNINNGVYKAGFAERQSVYEEEVKNIFDAFDRIEAHLEDHDFLVGDQLTEADLRLFPTLIRFEPVYYGHFKCNIKHLTEYPNLWNYTKRIYNYKDIKKTVNFYHIKKHYYTSHKKLDPMGIVPAGPELDLSLDK